MSDVDERWWPSQFGPEDQHGMLNHLQIGDRGYHGGTDDELAEAWGRHQPLPVQLGGVKPAMANAMRVGDQVTGWGGTEVAVDVFHHLRLRASTGLARAPSKRSCLVTLHASSKTIQHPPSTTLDNSL